MFLHHDELWARASNENDDRRRETNEVQEIRASKRHLRESEEEVWPYSRRFAQVNKLLLFFFFRIKR